MVFMIYVVIGLLPFWIIHNSIKWKMAEAVFKEELSKAFLELSKYKLALEDEKTSKFYNSWFEKVFVDGIDSKRLFPYSEALKMLFKLPEYMERSKKLANKENAIKEKAPKAYNQFLLAIGKAFATAHPLLSFLIALRMFSYINALSRKSRKKLVNNTQDLLIAENVTQRLIFDV